MHHNRRRESGLGHSRYNQERLHQGERERRRNREHDYDREPELGRERERARDRDLDRARERRQGFRIDRELGSRRQHLYTDPVDISDRERRQLYRSRRVREGANDLNASAESMMVLSMMLLFIRGRRQLGRPLRRP